MNTQETQSKTTVLIDFDQLNAACDGDMALLRELVELYFTQADQIVAGLERAVANQEVREVDHLAHKLAGSSLACGFSAIVPPLRRMEAAAKAGSLEGAEGSLAESKTTLEALRPAVQDYLRQTPAPQG